MDSITVDIMALVVSFSALALSLVQFLRDTSRSKKESTLNAYNELQDTAFNEINQILKTYKSVDDGKLHISPDHEKWEAVTNCLSKIERFSVGVNKGIYSNEIVKCVSGGYLNRLLDELSPVIERKESDNKTNGKHYSEFEHMIDELENIKYKPYTKQKSKQESKKTTEQEPKNENQE